MMLMIRHRRLEQQQGEGHSSSASGSRNDPFLAVPSAAGGGEEEHSLEAEHLILPEGGASPLLPTHQQPTASSSIATSSAVSLLLLFLQTLFPCCKWIYHYDVANCLYIDVISGISVGIMVIPQGMSYAVLAGLPVEYGLYGAVAPILAYAMFGSSRQLAVGPVAMVSLLFHNGLSQISTSTSTTTTTTTSTTNEDTSTEEEAKKGFEHTLAVQAAALVGLAYLAMCACRLGFVVTHYLSHAVISGFTSGAAVLIGLSQVQHIVGYKVQGSALVPILWDVVRNIDQINGSTVLYGTLLTLFLFMTKYLKLKYPKLQAIHIAGPLLVTITALLIPNANLTLPVVGEIPRGLPRLTIHDWWPLDDRMVQFLPTIASIVLVGFMESIAIAKQLAAKHNHHDEIDANAELYGLGMANLLGGAFHAYPISGSFSRSAVNSNAHSPLSGAVAATTVGIVLVFLTQVVQHLPLCALAAIVLAGVWSVMDVQEAFHLFALNDKRDFIVWTTACLGVLFLGVETGLTVAIAVSFAVLVPWQPSVHLMRHLRDDDDNSSAIYVDCDDVEQDSGNSDDSDAADDDVVVLRISSSLNFANSNWVWSKVQNHVMEHSRTKCIVLEMTAVSSIDTAATKHVKKWMHECESKHISVFLVGCSKNVKDRVVTSTGGDYHASIVAQMRIQDAVLCYQQGADRQSHNAADTT